MASLSSTHLRSKLPVEIVDMILQDLGPRHLQPLLTVNSFFYSIALQRLYHTIVPHSPTNSINLFRTLLRNPSLPPLVRALDINFATVSPTRNLYLLFHSVLLRLSALSSLTIELPRHHSPMWIFEGCTFKLTQFTTSHHCRLPLARFLDSQPGITDLTLRGFQNDNTSSMLSFLEPPLSHTTTASSLSSQHFSLLPISLPNLTTFNAVHAGAPIVRAIMTGRPVRVVSIPLFPNCVEESFSALQAGCGELSRLSVISFDPQAPGFLFEEVAKRFRKLEALHLVVLMADFTNEHLAASGRYLKSFDSLKYITCVASTKDTNTRTEECSLATEWHKLCPSLQTIILPKGRVWFHGRIGECDWSCLNDEDEEQVEGE